MILARCPACATTFRVRPEQLRARQGRVRCGQCNHAFNALETLVDENAVPIPREVHEVHPPLPPAPQPSPDTPLFVLEEKEPLPAGSDAAIPPEQAHEQPPAAETPAEDPAGMPEREELPPSVPDMPDSTPDTPAVDEDALFTSAPTALPPTDIDVPEEALQPGPEDTPERADVEADAAEAAPDDEAAPPPAAADPWPAMLDAPAAAPDARIEPGGEIVLPPEDEWPLEPPEARIDVPDAARIDTDEPAQAIDAPTTAPEPPLASDPLLEFGMDDDFPSAAPAAPQHFQADWPDPADLDLKASSPAAAGSEPPIDFDALLHKEDAGEHTAAPPLAVASAVPAAAPLPPPEPALPSAQDADKTPPQDEDTDEDGGADAEDEAAPPSALNQALWAAGATLLSLTLLAQGVLVFRNEIALSSPPTRPALEALCSSLGCELPLPREAAEIAIESSDIQPDASREALFTLHATLRNRAEFQQAWPHLEVTLTDARDKALVRRVLEPAQWLPADAPRDAFPARREIAARVAFEAPGVAAAGYRVYAFYP